MPENTAGTHPASPQTTPPIFPPRTALHPFPTLVCAGIPAETQDQHLALQNFTRITGPTSPAHPSLAVASPRAGLGFLALGCGHQLPLLLFMQQIPYLGTPALQEQGLGIKISFQNALSSQLQIQNGKCCSKFRAAILALALFLIQCSQDLSLR